MMLAVKNTLAERDEIPTMIFDEIDTGVSGRAAQKIGLKLKQAARHRQVLARHPFGAGCRSCGYAVFDS